MNFLVYWHIVFSDSYDLCSCLHGFKILRENTLNSNFLLDLYQGVGYKLISKITYPETHRDMKNNN